MSDTGAHGFEVEVTEAYKAWYLDLEKPQAAAVDRKVKMLQTLGVTLPFPHSSDIKGAKYPFRELRVNNPPIRACCTPSIPSARPCSSSAATRPATTASTSG
jgi:hypothetical protein